MGSKTDSSASPKRTCLVTIGATAPFNSLVSACLSPAFLRSLRESGYTDLLVQYGKNAAIFEEFIQSTPLQSELRYSIDIAGFGFNTQGLAEEMKLAKGSRRGNIEGLVVSHAGSGSVLDALRIDVPLIVVPNPELLDNHQLELAEELAAQGYAVHGHLDDLPAALARSETARRDRKGWPPVNSGADPPGRGLIGVMDDEMGFLD